MREYLAPGGALLARTAHASRMIADVMGRHLQCDEGYNRQLAEVERGPWFRVIAAGFRA
jgi:hypothetical protein